MIFAQTLEDRNVMGSAALSSSDINANSSVPPGGGFNFIRRPTRGIQLKDDTFATIRILANNGTGAQYLIDAGSRRQDHNGFMTVGDKRATDIYSNFLLQQVSEERAEKQQILETFGEAYIFLFGERARIISFQGILANTFDFNWEAEWWYNYEEYLRGTRCVDNGARVYISYDQTVVGGYILATSSSKDATNPNYVTFGFQLFVTSYNNFSAVGNENAFDGKDVPADILANIKNGTLQLTKDQLAQYRPHPTTESDIQVNYANPFGNPASVFSSLEDALQEGITNVTNSWNAIQDVVNSGLNTISTLLDPSGGVRVPTGFAGSMVFYNDNVTHPSAEEVTALSNSRGRIRYTIFRDNEDEYVGSSDQYMTSSMSIDDSSRNAWASWGAGEELTYAQNMVEKAKAFWAKNGLTVPTDQLGPVSRFLTSKAVGLVGVGTTAAWKAVSPALNSTLKDAGITSALDTKVVIPGSAAPPAFAPITSVVSTAKTSGIPGYIE